MTDDRPPIIGTYEAMPLLDEVTFRDNVDGGDEGYRRLFAHMHDVEPDDVELHHGRSYYGPPIVGATITVRRNPGDVLHHVAATPIDGDHSLIVGRVPCRNLDGPNPERQA